MLKTEADAFCKVHNPDKWQTTMSGIERINALAKEIRTVVKSEKMLNIFKEELTMNSSEFRQRYEHHSVFYEEKISVLLNEDWTCDYLKYHYLRPDDLIPKN